jgi:hypothetical protein
MGTPETRTDEATRWAVAQQITSELAAEVGVTDADREWAATVLGIERGQE